jgi:hypothetical protein
MAQAETCGEAQPHDVVFFVASLARAKVVPSPQLVAHLAKLYLADSSKLHPITTTSLVSSLASLGASLPDELVDLTSARMLQWNRRGGNLPVNLPSDYLYALATGGKKLHIDLVRNFSSEAVRRKDEFMPSSIARFLFALATAGAPLHVMLVWEMSRRAVALRADFTPTDISMMLWALIKAGARPAPELVKVMTDEALSKVMCLFLSLLPSCSLLSTLCSLLSVLLPRV